jgi:subtilase family serine protease
MSRKLSSPILVSTAFWLAATYGMVYAASLTVLRGNHPALAEHLAFRGDASPQLPLTMRITLALRNQTALQQLLHDQQDPVSPSYHQWLTPTQFDAAFGPSPGEAAAVASWLVAKGLQVTSSSIAMRSITFTGTATVAQQAFQTSIKMLNGGAYTNIADPMIPSQFAGAIARIDGLDNIRSFLPVVRHPRATAPAAEQSASTTVETGDVASDDAAIGVNPEAETAHGDYFGPNDFYSFYDETPLKAVGIDGATASGDCIGIVGVSDFLDKAISGFNSHFHLPASNIIRVPINAANPGFNSDEPETLIDLEWSHTAAPGAPIRYYMGAGADDLLDAISGAVTDDKCAVISISYGYCVSDSTFYTATLDPLFEQAASQGQSVFVASGDQGAAGIVAAGAAGNQCAIGGSRHVSEMSADPNVTTVGGVSFNPDFTGNGKIDVDIPERAWNDTDDPSGAYPAPFNGASGGGASAVFPKPDYQAGEGVPADGARDVPDIALMASPFYPGMIVADDRSCDTASGCDGKGSVSYDIFGGTSIASPAFAGVAKLIEQIAGERLGNINPKLYSLGADAAANGIRDITRGNNNYEYIKGFAATAGYDQVTGWGTIDVAEFAQAFGGSLPAAATLRVKPAAMRFGTLAANQSKTLTLTISNPRRQKANINISAITSGDGYTASSNCLGILMTGHKCKVSVTFTPDISATAYNTSLTITDDAGDAPQQVTLIGASH